MTAGQQDTGAADRAGEKAEKPFFEIVAGNPSPVEVGILSAIFATAQCNAVNDRDNHRGIKNDWGRYSDRLRQPFGYNPSSFLNRNQY